MRGPNYRALQKRQRSKLRRLKKEFKKSDDHFQVALQQSQDINTVYYLTRDRRFLKQKHKLNKAYLKAYHKALRIAIEIGTYVKYLRKKKPESRIRVPPRVQYVRQLNYMRAYRKTHKAKSRYVKVKKEIVPKPRYEERKTTHGITSGFTGFVVALFTCLIRDSYDGFVKGDRVRHYITAHIEEGYMTLGNSSGPFDPRGMTKRSLARELAKRHMGIYPHHQVLQVKIEKVIIKI
jgi:hypothetical protein